MRRFLLTLSPSAVRDLDRLEDKTARKILEKASALEGNPFPRGKLIKKIRGKKFVLYRLRVGRDHVFYSIEKMKVVILKVIDKKDADRFIRAVDL